MIGEAAVPMILMAFGMSLRGARPLGSRSGRAAALTVVALKNLVMPAVAFAMAYWGMGFRGPVLYACVVLAALPTGQNVYNYAASYNAGVAFSRDCILVSTIVSPFVIATIALALG